MSIEAQTPRLRLVALDLALAEDQLANAKRFFTKLGAYAPPDWPPPLNDEATMTWTRDRLAEGEHQIGWQSWVFLLRGPGHGLDAPIGLGGFKGPPDAAGVVELGYSLLPAHEGRGYATEAVQGLMAWASGDGRVRRFRAQTLVDGFASQRVLQRCGFTPAPPLEEGALCWERAA